MLDQNKKLRRETMSSPRLQVADMIGVPEPSCRDSAARALTIVRDGVITGEGPTTRGRVHFSRSLDADDASLCARILMARAVEHQPVSRAEAEALFEINDAASESGLKVPPRTVALSPDTDIESWAPAHAHGVNTEVLEWIASQMRGKHRRNRTLMAMVATFVGAAALPLAQLPNMFDIGM